MKTRKLDGYDVVDQSIIGMIIEKCTNEGCKLDKLCERCESLYHIIENPGIIQVPLEKILENVRDPDMISEFL